MTGEKAKINHILWRAYVKKLAVLAFFFAAEIGSGQFGKYSGLQVADPNGLRPSERTIRVTYLGVNGYQLEANNHVLLVDPYFTRVGLTAVVLNQSLQSQPARVDEGFSHLQKSADAILVTHAHFDHLLDVPDLMRRTSAKLIAGPTAIKFAESLGVPAGKCDPVLPGAVRRVEPWTIKVLLAQHDHLLGAIPFSGKATRLPPRTAADWKLGEPLAFLIEANGKRIYIDSGGTPNELPPTYIAPVDLAILGVALPDSRARYAATVRRLQPRYVLPSHQDDFFAPLARGFTFGKLTNFPAIARSQTREHLPGQLILLDYFRPWTLR